ncbi:MAG: EpsG family protein [Devosia sp.]|uniref:EpsG family protein n=1 Tax=Devosia sp. TaxID=1871048 RepID=UPI002612051C|nr:EpsG family protein [Devosia sp.]MDB5540761.1 EpsG family protein [Devosia sp.]
MVPYWLIFSIPAFATLFENGDWRRRRDVENIAFLLAIAFTGILVGLRYDVGGDWSSYLGYLDRAAYLGFHEIPTAGDPGYILLNWLAARFGGDIWLVNLACAGLFCWGLFEFCRMQPRPWLALAVAVPYLVVVVAMGYTRQGVAIGLSMLGLVALAQQGSTLKFVFWVVLAATFHKTAVLLIPIAALTSDRGRWWTFLWVAAAAAAAYFVLLADRVDDLIYGYVESEYDSSGASIRTAMNVLPATLLLVFRDRFPMPPREKRLWLIVAAVAIATVPTLILSPSTTAVDRLSLYLIPIQMVVLSRVPGAFGRSERTQRFLAVAVLIYSGLALFVWLNFASHSWAWLPYQFYFQ